MHRSRIPRRIAVTFLLGATLLIAILIVAVGCSSETAEVVATAEPAASPTPQPEATAELEGTSTEAPSPTAAPSPTSTPTPVPTATPMPTPTPIPTSTPIPNTSPVITNPDSKSFEQGESITPFSITVTDAEDSPTVVLSDLPPGLSYRSGWVNGTIDSDTSAANYVVTVSADDGVNPVVSATFTITVTSNNPPVITNPGDKNYEQGETITRFNITVVDSGDRPTVTVSGLPVGLSYISGRVSGTIDSNATAKDYVVTVSADDGVNPVVSATFTITVTPNNPPVITNPGNKSYEQGESISGFNITVTDAEDSPTVTVSGLPVGLSYISGRVSGTIDSNATAKDYVVTVSADDGVNPVVSATFTITVTPNNPPVITNPGNKNYHQGETISAFDIKVTDAEDTPTVRLSGLPAGLSYQSGQVVGTISSQASARDYRITISANDGVHTTVSTTFTIAVKRGIAFSQTCSDEWFIGAIIELSEERESSFSPRILKLYTDKIEEVERTVKLLSCKAEAKMSQGGEVFLSYHYEIDRDGDGFIGYSVGDPVPPPGSTLNDAYAVGTVMTGSDGTQIRAISITADAWPLVYAENRFNDPPEEGNRFFMVRVEVVNPSDALQSVDVDDFDFKLIGDNRVVYSYSEGCGVIPDELDREIFPGGRAEGNVCFEVPESERGMILIHEPGYGTENRRFLILTD